jgi:hypothetical protein
MIFGDDRLPIRIWEKIAVDQDGCWIWRGTFAGHPQTRWKVDGAFKTVSVRRVIYEAAHGPCDLPVIGGCKLACVNPLHVKPFARGELEKKRAAERRPTVCRHGHVLAEVGVYLGKVKGGRVVSHCRVCAHAGSRVWAEKRRLRRVRRMSPARREEYERRRVAGLKAWESRRSRIAQ